MNTLMILDLWRLLGQLRRRDGWTRAELEAHQTQALGRLRAHAFAHSTFYRRSYVGFTDKPFDQLPILTKATLMEHFDELVTDPAIRLDRARAYLADADERRRFLDRYWVSATSGSTGRPGVFVFDRAEWLVVLASFARAHEWAGVPVRLTHRMKMAAIASTAPSLMSAQAAATLKSWWMPALRLAAEEPVETLVERHNRWQPEMVVAYASMARLLASAQLRGELRIAPRLVFTSSEVLTAETRRLIEAAWGLQPFDHSAATETGGLAAECSHHRGMHLQEDLVLVEVVDDRNRPMPPGEDGAKLLISGLFGRTQPLIRYELSDSLRLAPEPCPCGRPFRLVDAIQGWIEDVLHLPAMGGGEVVVQPVIFSRVLDPLPVGGWQVVQAADRALTVYLSGAPNELADDLVVSPLRRALLALGAEVIPLVVERVAVIPKGAAGKSPLVRASRGGPPGPSAAANTPCRAP